MVCMDPGRLSLTDDQADSQGRSGAPDLERERGRTQAILEAAGEAVVVTDANGLIRYMNPAAVALTGFAAGEADAEEGIIRSGPTLPACYEALMEEVKCSGQIRRGEAVYKQRDGTLRDIALTVAAVREPETGDLAGFVSVARDITPLETAQRMKDEFVSDVSHELRTPFQ
jgi:PAS domain S-box-containing protein